MQLSCIYVPGYLPCSLIKIHTLKSAATIPVVRLNVRNALSVVLLALYIASALGIDFAHQVFHRHAVEITHTPEDELDPCHRTLFHQDSVQDCDHSAHITSEEKCKCIHLAFQQQYTFAQQPAAGNPQHDCVIASPYQFSASEAEHLIAYLRGPPVA